MKENFEPRKWQSEAFSKWQENMRGVVAAVTASGKTSLALMCAEEFIRRVPDGRVAIIVPTIALLDQWHITLVEDGGIDSTEIGLVSGAHRKWHNKPFLIAVINSARNLAEQFVDAGPTMIVVDECHRSGSPQNARIFGVQYAASLGLSATPERQYDNAFQDVIEPALGEIIYQYGYEEAYRDGIVSPFSLVNIRFALDADEQAAYDSLTRRIAVLLKKPSQESAERVKFLLTQRARISWNSSLRVPLASKAALRHKGERIIIFHESVQQANDIYNLLLNRGIRTTLYHTGLSPEKRRENLRLFRNRYYSCLVSCRALDEGLDVPGISVGIIASGTASIRQRVQRLGRVLRKAPGKESAIIYTLYATESEEARLLRESTQLSEITSVRWLEASLN